MAASGNLEFALLGLLARDSATGYDLTRRLNEELRWFWPTARSHVYPALRRLEAAGWATFNRVEQTTRPDKKVFHITARGREALAQWVTSPLPGPAERDELVLRVYSLWLADRDQLLELLARHSMLHRDRLAHYRLIEHNFQLAVPHWQTLSWQHPYISSYATLRRGIGYEEEYCAWIAWLQELVDRQAEAAHPQAEC